MTTPWLDGLWAFGRYQYLVVEVKGQNAIYKNKAHYDFPEEDIKPIGDGIWESGIYEDTTEEINKLTGESKFNLKMVAFDGKMTMYGVLAEDGKSMTSTSFDGKGVEHFNWISKEQLEQSMDERESCLNPITFHKLQPEIQGKLLFISGPPGAGKSTSGLLLAKTQNYVYYEADCFMNFVNPYLPLDCTNPSVDAVYQNPLKGFPLVTVKVMAGLMKDYMDMSEGKGYDRENIKGFYREMAKNIAYEKERVGGPNWVVAQAVPHRWLREHIKQIIGPDCIFVVLCISEETQKRRVEKRYVGMDESVKEFVVDLCVGMAKNYENAGEDEDNAVNVHIGPDDTEEDVIAKIQDTVKPLL